MSLIINSNPSALFAQDALRSNHTRQATAMERLATGTRINSASDDAAGLAISQNMTAQVRGLNQAVRNLNDGVNMLQTAEGALAGTTAMLQRMRELAVQSMNGSYSNDQRGYLDQEFQALATQIASIGNETEWNGQALLNASANATSGVAATNTVTSFTPAFTTSGGTLAANTITANGSAVGEVTLTSQAYSAAVPAAQAAVPAATLTIGTLAAGSAYKIKTNTSVVSLIATGIAAVDAANFAAAYNAIPTRSTTFTVGTGPNANVLTASSPGWTLSIDNVRTAAQVAAGVSDMLARVAKDTANRDANAAGFMMSSGAIGKQSMGGAAYNGQQIAAAIKVTIPRQSRGLSNCEPLKAAKRGR